ncbi:MAG: EAL domain-containing protein [Actinomycetes bacterium]
MAGRTLTRAAGRLVLLPGAGPGAEDRPGDAMPGRLADDQASGTQAASDFDELAELTAVACQARLSAIMIRDPGGDRVLACRGLSVRRLPDGQGCTDPRLVGAGEVLVVSDVHRDARTAHLPASLGAPDLRAYAAVPLLGPAGTVLGVLCVGDPAPSRFTRRHARVLAALGHRVVDQLELSRIRHELIAAVADAQSARELVGAVIDASPTAMALYDEAGLVVVHANPRYARVLGLPQDQLAGIDLAQLTCEEDLPAEREGLARLLSGGVGVWRREKGYRRDDGSSVRVLVATTLVRGADGQARYLVSAVEPADDLRRTEAVLAATDAAADGIISLDAAGQVVSWNRGAERLTGWCEPDVRGRSLQAVCPVRMSATDRRVWDHLLGGGVGDLLGRTVELPIRCADGKSRRVEIALSTWTDPGGTYYSAVVRDVSERHAAAARLAYEQTHDPLTRLPNRAFLRDRLTHLLGSAEDAAAVGGVAVICLDIDRFSLVNDSLGHRAGDRLLCELGRRLKSAVRRGDQVGRVGADEFMIVARGVPNTDEAVELAQRVRRCLVRPFTGRLRTVNVSVSCGVTWARAPHPDPAEVVQDADAALQAARRSGTGIAAYQDSMRQAARDQMALEAGLRRALEREEFVVHYQPEVDPRTGRVVGHEALVRWARPDTGLVGPDEFIPLAERTGLVVPLGAWVLDQALAQLAEWTRRGICDADAFVSVNLSARQVGSPELTSMVLRALARHRITPGRLWLELTETAVLDDVGSARVRLTELAARGVRLALDDFGTGYASLTYLRELPFHALKIDKSFVSGVSPGSATYPLVRAVIAMAGALGITCVAEGVEDPDELNVLVDLGCDLVQGYHLGRPVPAEQVVRHGA